MAKIAYHFLWSEVNEPWKHEKVTVCGWGCVCVSVCVVGMYMCKCRRRWVMYVAYCTSLVPRHTSHRGSSYGVMRIALYCQTGMLWLLYNN